MDGRVAYYPFVHEADSDDDTGKMKRKHEDGAPAVTDDFSDLSFSSPPTKIRRLDVEFPPAPAIHFEHEGSDEARLPQLEAGYAVAAGDEPCMDKTEATDQASVDAGEDMSSNEERAIVLYRPVEPAGPHFSFSVLPHFVPAFAVRDRLVVHTNTGEESLAVVPWAPNNFNANPSRQREVELLNDSSEDMELEMEQHDQHKQETAQAIMNANGNEGSFLTDGSRYQWQHQNQMHCTVPQFPLHSAPPATPVTWSW